MLAKQLIEWVLIAFIVVEIIIPLLFAKPMFYHFRRRKASKLLAEQESLGALLEEDQLKERLAVLRKQHEENEARLHPPEVKEPEVKASEEPPTA